MSISISLRNFIYEFTNKKSFTLKPLKKGFSDRNIFRVYADRISFIAIESDLIAENIAFIEFTKSFNSLNFKVPDILKISDDKTMYLTTDLGEITLYDFIIENINNRKILLYYYQKSINDLFLFQTKGNSVIDYKYCYQTNSFNAEQIISDENKFLMYYGRSLPGFESELFKNAFNILNENLYLAYSGYFMYRDFQPRNIIVNNSELHYIDYQSGRKGPLQYDLASFLYSGSINISNEEKTLILNHYLEILKRDKIDIPSFLETFNYFILIRLLQMIGSYAYQILEKKLATTYFTDKIRKVLVHLQTINNSIPEKEIKLMLDKIIFIHI